MAKNSKTRVCFGTNVGTNQAILLGFLRSLVSTIRCEANKSNRRRFGGAKRVSERPIGSLAVKMLRQLRDLRRRTRGLAQDVAAANARVEVRARMHNWSIAWWLTRKCDLLAGNRQSKTQRVEDSARFLEFTRARHHMKLIRARCCAHCRRAEWTSGAPFGSNEISIFCPRTLQAERDFFKYKPSKQVISLQYIDKPMIYCRFLARALRPVSDG